MNAGIRPKTERLWLARFGKFTILTFSSDQANSEEGGQQSPLLSEFDEVPLPEGAIASSFNSTGTDRRITCRRSRRQWPRSFPIAGSAMRGGGARRRLLSPKKTQPEAYHHEKSMD